MKNDIMSLDIKIGYEEILKSEKILKTLTIGQLKGIHYNLHKIYNRVSTKNDTKCLIFKAHNILMTRFSCLELEHKQIDKLDILRKPHIIEKKKIEIKKRPVFLLRKSYIKVG